MNSLRNELSPYLLQHADNPVSWYPWGNHALEKAVQEEKPIFLSIGYAACHWCHVMEKESFYDPKTAEILNSYFISIKVDREERPDIDKIYMDAVTAMTGSGGWPLSVFLTPEGKPFYGGTYFPPSPRHGMPSFTQILNSIAQNWSNNRKQLVDQSNRVLHHLKSQLISQVSKADLNGLNFETLNQSFLKQVDWNFGGFGSQPKFPQPKTLEWLLLLSTIEENQKAEQALLLTLDQMSLGGLRDLVRGGFHRYSVDNKWLVPHFEKMLYDNALLSQLYLFTGISRDNNNYIKICAETIDFVLEEMKDPKGGFWSSLDADSEGEEGKFYTWDYDEIRSLFDTSEWLELNEIFDISEHGNYEGKIILRSKSSPAIKELTPDYGLLKKLKTFQNSRVRPAADDKILTDWNGMMLSTLSLASLVLERADYLGEAKKCADFLLKHHWVNGRLKHTSRLGQASNDGLLSDYAHLANGLLDLFQADPDQRWFSKAKILLDTMVELFWDGEQFFETAGDQEQLILRPVILEDHPVPSGFAQALMAFLKLNQIEYHPDFARIIEKSLSRQVNPVSQYPTAFSYWLQVFFFFQNQLNTWVVIENGNDPLTFKQMKAFLQKKYLINTSYFFIPAQNSALESIELFEGKSSRDGKTTAYYCKGSSCFPPVHSIEEIKKIIK